MIDIPGYQILALIYESDRSIVYRGRREQDKQPVVLKVLKKDYPTAEEISRYRQEYEITRSLNLPSVVKAYALEKYQNTLVTILEDFGGESLRILMNSQKFTLLGFLNLAIQITQSLGEIHAANIIHKDINPSNITFNPATGDLKIIDFSIASILTRDNPTIQNPHALEGTLAYMSPEQTGRMNRSLDYRTDFYSLGVTFYELLTGQLPFPSTDAMELVHAHLAKQPTPPHEINPEIPPVLSEIILKLLAKTPEKRYQSAWGLGTDLEECLKQLEQNDRIEAFPLATQDISDKFQIPQKLYGREKELNTLAQAFENARQGRSELMLVAGYSGIGKSALVREISKQISDNGGYFIAGKFDQFQRSIPYSAIVSAFSELVQQLLTQSEEELEVWKGKLIDSFGSNGQIIIDVIPEIEFIVGPQPPVQVLGPNESQNRFNLVFQNFIRVFCDREHPLVIFIDDLQWADSATLKLLELMMGEEAIGSLLILGAYRDNEVSPTHPLMMSLEALEKRGSTIHKMVLQPLNLEHICELTAETLHAELAKVQRLGKLIQSKTQGNPFFVIQFLKTLYQENMLTFIPPQPGKVGGWDWDIDRIEAVGITDNVIELMVGKLKKLPDSTQEVLRLAACLGNQFDLNTLSLIHEKEASETLQHLLPAIEDRLILPGGESDENENQPINPLLILNYKFLHDRVQQAAYALIEDADKKAVHLRIGRMLLVSTPPEYWTERIFELVDHLNVARESIEDEAEKIQLAQLNLEAAKKAKMATAYVAARQYLIAGMEGLSDRLWKIDYDLAFSLYRERADVEYLNGNFEGSEQFIVKTLANINNNLQKAELYNLLIVQNSLRAKYKEATQAGKEGLKLLNVELEEEGLDEAIARELEQVKRNLGDREIITLSEDNPLENPEIKIALSLLTNLLTPAYLSSLQLWILSLLKGVNLSLKHGSIAESGLLYCNYGLLAGSMSQDYHAAYQFGRLALELTEKWNNLQFKCKALASIANGLNYWFKPIQESNLLNQEGYKAALESGDLEYAGYFLHNEELNAFFQGKPLEEISSKIPKYLHFARRTKNQLSTDTLLGLQIMLRDLWNNKGQNFLDSEELDEAEYLANCREHQNFYSLCIYQIHKFHLLYLEGDFENALEWAREAEGQLASITGTIPATEYNFFSSLLWAALYPTSSAEEQSQYWGKLEANQQQMKVWADNCPANFLHKCCLVEAEMARISGNIEGAIAAYDRAIQSAHEFDFVQNEALANELAARFWLEQGKEKYAKVHLTDAYYAYRRWGARRKIEQLEQGYSHLLVKTPPPPATIDTRTTAIHTTTSGGSSGLLDLATVMKASQAISSEIVLDKLLSSLMKILIENAGAERGVLLFPKNGELAIAAEASATQERVVVRDYNAGDLQMRGLSPEDLPVTAINYVERTRGDIVLDRATEEGRFNTDPYIVRYQVKSLLCTPILDRGQLIAILYLENNLTVGAFTPDRLEFLRLISSQAAISLENALLYASVEQKVRERTQELNEKNLRLEQTLRELQRTQAQLIQSEKMSSLGQLVAGVAHEINNPVSFIYGNLSPAGDYVRDLLGLIQLYRERYPDPGPEIQAEIEDIDLDFLVEDLQKLLNSMKVGAERIRNIVLSLRNFSRHDEAEMKPVDIHEGIASTLTILQPRLKQGGGGRGIQTIEEYGRLPKVTCYASQLNQVFMNIFSNAIDAFENGGPSDPAPTIRIHTEAPDDLSILIRIADNGCGMSEEVCQRIFDPFYTTKPVGGGTGLGLSIGYSIVVDAHGGELSCVSQLGKGSEFTIRIPISPPPRSHP
ncbi:AAA family ATPase [Oxynema sp. CENA135]|uniref:trifunctional serine/threonine-protein kinase/ATP-binding protein/sensor histidine kinase n=1 Tax=Oxynema sp. CENA135 TaxID=984206 RepID=UPI00190E1EC6|nr:ATP-binding sensor histidine kinase [Oxynema sp. CENA135]MBK4728400.1 AAA family ATPase [Oxynema sp. CENA135]